MSYQEQLAYLRQKREQQVNSVSQAPSAAQQQQQEQWQEMDEDAVKAIEQRQQEDQWLEDAGMINTATSMDISRLGKDEEDLFMKEFENSPLTKKYGGKIDQLVQELMAEVNNPDSEFNGQQAVQVFNDFVDKMVKGDFDDVDE